TDVHSLEPEDLCALTVEAAAMAKVPLAGTNYIPGVTEEATLEELKTMMQKYLADTGQYAGAGPDERPAPDDQGHARRRGARRTPVPLPGGPVAGRGHRPGRAHAR